MKTLSHLATLAGIAVIAVSAVRADPLLVDPENWTLEEMSVVVEEGGLRNVNARFEGKPWVDFQIFATPNLVAKTPLGLAAEEDAGEYLFHHSSNEGRYFYLAEIEAPSDLRTLEAHWYAGMASLCAATHRYALAYTRETEHAIAGALIQIGQQIEQANQALMGQVNVVDLQNGNFHVSWAGNQQVVNGPAARDAAAQNYQQQRNATQAQLVIDQEETGNLDWLRDATFAVEPLGVSEMNLLDGEATRITTYLPLPTGSVFLPYDAPLAWFDLDTATTDKAAAEKEKAALQQRIARLRQEATRKRQLAGQPMQIFGIGGVWFVRWANVELTYPSQAQAESLGANFINNLKAQRLAEADALDAQADALEAQLPALDAKIAGLTALCTSLDPVYQAKLAVQPPGGVLKPQDTAKPRAKFKFWIDFPPDYIDPYWEEIYREWQARKDALRNQLQAMGASQQQIDDAMGDMDRQMNPRRKWMLVFLGEGIHLDLNFVNQFTGFTVDVANAKWEVEYENYATGQIEKQLVGTGDSIDIPPGEVVDIFNHAKLVQNQPGLGVLVNITVTVPLIRPDGTTTYTKVTQQIMVVNETRAAHDERMAGIPR